MVEKEERWITEYYEIISTDEPNEVRELVKKRAKESSGAVVKNTPADAGDMGSSPGLGRSDTPWSN